MPLRYEVTASYSDLAGTRQHNDPPNILDVAPFTHTSGDRDDLHQIAQRVKGIEQAMKQWTQRGRLGVDSVAQSEAVSWTASGLMYVERAVDPDTRRAPKGRGPGSSPHG